jgi:hypothetical protein
MKKLLLTGITVVAALFCSTSADAQKFFSNLYLNTADSIYTFKDTEVGASVSTSPALHFRVSGLLNYTTDTVYIKVENADPADTDTIFSMDVVKGTASENVWFLQNIKFSPRKAKTYTATLSVYVNHVAIPFEESSKLYANVTFKGTGVFGLLDFGTVNIIKTGSKSFTFAGLAAEPTISVKDFEGNGHAPYFSILSSEWDDFGANETVNMQFAPTEPLQYKAVLAANDGTEYPLTMIGKGTDNPTRSNAAKDVWYYLKFVDGTNRVIQQNGDGEPLTANEYLEFDTQLWKIVNTAADESAAIFCSKADTTLRIQYFSVSPADPAKPNGYYATKTPPDANINDMTSIYTVEQQVTTNYLSISRTAGSNTVNYYIKPENNLEGAKLVRQGTSSSDYSTSYLRFVYHSEDVKYVESIGADAAAAADISVYPSPATEFVKVKYPANTLSLSLVNALGQTLKTVQPDASGEQLISVSTLPAGLYLVRINNASGVETGKFVKQ